MELMVPVGYTKELYTSSSLSCDYTNMKASQHNRSNSVPSASHPLTSQYEEHINRLKASEASSSSSVSQKLNDLQHLHDCTNKMLQLPTTQQTLGQQSCKTWVDELLEGSLRLLDICSTVKDVLLQSTESIHELQSAVRRKRGGEIALKMEGNKYLSSRRKVKKAIRKALENFKVISKDLISASLSKDSKSVSMIITLKEAQVITLIQLESLLSFISGSRRKPKERRWSIVSKLMQPKRVCSDSDQPNTNAFEEVNTALQSLLCRSIMSVESFQNNLENLESCIEVLEAGIDHLQRQLIRTRVSLLNICNH